MHKLMKEFEKLKDKNSRFVRLMPESEYEDLLETYKFALSVSETEIGVEILKAKIELMLNARKDFKS